MFKKQLFIFASIIFLFTLAFASKSANFTSDPQTVGAGGNKSGSANFNSVNAVGEVDTHKTTSSSFGSAGGFIPILGVVGTTTTTTTSTTTSTTTTTSTSTTTTTTTTVPNGGTVIFNHQGCVYSDIKCPLTYSSCSYQFIRNGVTFPTLVSCDSFNIRTNPGTLSSGKSMCPSYDNGGFASTITCTVIGYGGSTSSTTTTTSATSTTSTTSTTTTTPQTSTTTTTQSSGTTTIFDSFGCTVGNLVCPSNYQSCSYQLTKNGAIYPSIISCDSFNIQPNPGTINSGKSVCPSYDSSKGFANNIRCQVFGYDSPSTTTSTTTSTTSTTSSTTTTTPQTSTTTTTQSSNSGTVVFSKLGCNYPQIQCPSNYNHCTYQFTKYGSIYPAVVSCDPLNIRNNPGILSSGKSMCPSYDTNGFSTAINCTVIGYRTV